jgi:hypothetical protein
MTNTLTCTGRYSGLARNGIGGNLNKPCGNDWDIQLYCNQADVDAWRTTAESLFHRVRAEWNATAKAHTIPTEVATYITQMENEYCSADADGLCVKYWLPESSWWDVNWNAQASSAIAKWCARAACALELLDNVRDIQGPIEATQENTEISPDIAEGIGAVGKGLGAVGEGLGEAIGAVGQGTGEAVGGIGGALHGVGQGLAWLPIGLGILGASAAVVGSIYLLRR